MEDAFDLLDAIDLLSSLSEADALEHGGLDVLSQLLDAADYVPYGSHNVELLGMLDPENQNFWSAGIDLLDSGSDHFMSSALEGIDVDAMDLSSVFNDNTYEMMNEAVLANGHEYPGMVEGLINSYHQANMPSAFTEGLTLHYSPDSVPRVLGEYDHLTQSLQINDSPNEAFATYFHEVGHHVADKSYPEMFGHFESLIKTDPSLLDPLFENEFLQEYDNHLHPHEAFAEFFSNYFSQTEILKKQSPQVFDFMNQLFSRGWHESLPQAV